MKPELDEIIIPTVTSSEDLLPIYASEGASGADLKAHVSEPVIVPAQGIALIPTGIKVAIPKGYEVQVRPRSGLALKHGISVLNTPGTVDSDYRGEIRVILINHSKEDFFVTPGMRIAQAVVAKVTLGKFVLSDELDATARNEKGFGSSGIR